MMLVMLGTNPYPFGRLLNAAGAYARTAGVRVIAQTGNTPPCPDVECHAFVEHARLMEWVDEADVVIVQGGYGSLSDCISRGAKTVAVPRCVSLGESVDDQKELVQAFAAEGLVIPVYEIGTLPQAIESAMSMPRRTPEPSRLPGHIAQTIRAMCGKH